MAYDTTVYDVGLARGVRERELAWLDADSAYLILHSRKDRRNLARAPNQRRVACWTPAHHRLERLARKGSGRGR